MNTKTVLTISSLALGLFSLGLPTPADNAMSGMDMGGMKTAQKSRPAPLSVTAAIKPNPPRTGNNALDLLVTDAENKPVTGLKLTTSVAMTSMDMGTTTPAFMDSGNGHYTTIVVFGMAGPWRVIVKRSGSKLTVLDFQAGSKTPWKSPAIKTSRAAVPAVPSAAAAAPPQATPTAAMPGMDMSGAGMADIKTATIPQLQEKGTYTATGNENWKQQTGFGHNAPMVEMMNQMMVGGSGGEGMKMAPMKMKFGTANYAITEANDTGDMAGMDMGGPGALKITAAMSSSAKAGDNVLNIVVVDAAGKPLTGAKITTTVAMTSMDMGTTRPTVTEQGNGRYATTVNFGMTGPWRVQVSVTLPGQKTRSQAFDFTAR